uniref:Uncharacterized protein n=1 Tax=Medicago truncatula TaxID=3880 RepID=A2Q4J4_MEDTR|nr:hypothetical protein MtrDRAFT_AC157502g27v2 [Medicago truncatula]
MLEKLGDSSTCSIFTCRDYCPLEFKTYVPVSLEIKDTVVRSYRTDPVQVRS